ncbi:hypothetical protein E2C01_094761 [Portunus trituberculatus]|uniref:Uncharacterized protein n=1 Tax=Portunus trituberculatus TaxID=210409 RepID=A0A5B7JTC6_PORTR|nr:hypothetical protein [Portunus trituberculatus]
MLLHYYPQSARLGLSLTVPHPGKRHRLLAQEDPSAKMGGKKLGRGAVKKAVSTHALYMY